MIDHYLVSLGLRAPGATLTRRDGSSPIDVPSRPIWRNSSWLI